MVRCFSQVQCLIVNSVRKWRRTERYPFTPSNLFNAGQIAHICMRFIRFNRPSSSHHCFHFTITTNTTALPLPSDLLLPTENPTIHKHISHHTFPCSITLFSLRYAFASFKSAKHISVKTMLVETAPACGQCVMTSGRRRIEFFFHTICGNCTKHGAKMRVCGPLKMRVSLFACHLSYGV